MAAYNAERYLAESITSVLSQTYTNWELLVINDGSSDNTENIITSFSDPRIRYFTQSNSGVSAARNKGLTEMRGSFFCFLDADDYLPPASVSKRVLFMLHNPTVDMLDGVVQVRDAQLEYVLRTYRPSFKGNPSAEYVRLNKQVFFGPNLFIRNRNTIYRFEEGMTHAEDLWFYTKLAWLNKLNYDYLNDVVYLYRKTNISAMSNLSGLENGYKKYLALSANLPGIQHEQIIYLKNRIKRILVLSYLRAGKLSKAARVFFWIDSDRGSQQSRH
jgi:glycosyltransferase involved in cell wall biosynthesis